MVKKTKTITVVRTKARRRRRRALKDVAPNRAMSLTASYLKSLVDPFEHNGVKLGWGCMVPSTVITAYSRFSISASAIDGSLALLLLPCSTNPCRIGTLGASAAIGTATYNNTANQASITNSCAEGRVISAGIRAFPSIAMTVPPGVVYTGALVATTWTNLQTINPTQLASSVTSQQTIGLHGASATGRPVDPDSFTFTTVAVDGNGYNSAAHTGDTIPFSVPYIVFLGLPEGATVFVEIVINIEGTPSIGVNQTPLYGHSSFTEESLSDYWPTFEGMWNRVKSILPSPGRLLEDAATLDADKISKILNGVGNVASAVNAFRGSTNMGALLRTPSLAYGGSGFGYPSGFQAYIK